MDVDDVPLLESRYVPSSGCGSSLLLRSIEKDTSRSQEVDSQKPSPPPTGQGTREERNSRGKKSSMKHTARLVCVVKGEV